MYWSTTWDRSNLLAAISPTTPINFVTPGKIGSADIVVDDSTVYQTMAGFGATLSKHPKILPCVYKADSSVIADGSASLLSGLKSADATAYYTLLNYLFDPTDGANAGGLSYLRVPLGASDFSANIYSMDDMSGDTSFADFNIDAAPSYLFSTIVDILTCLDEDLSYDERGLIGDFVCHPMSETMFTLCLTTLIEMRYKNEPENSNPSYPSTLVPAAIEAQIGIALRSLMNANGYSSVHLFGFEHNWNDSTGYPVQLIQQAKGAFDSISFHCYGGTVDEQGDFQTLYPDIDIYQTECTGMLGTDWWSDIKWSTNTLMIGAPNYFAKTAAMWNLALDGSGGPELPGASSCIGGCRGVVTVNDNGSYTFVAVLISFNWLVDVYLARISVNQEFYAMAQASKAVLPKDAGGPWGQRIDVSIGGGSDWALVVGAYKTERLSPTDWNRYSLVVLNWQAYISQSRTSI
ncbi:hypothetical protein HWV62_25350 [Athelia sp. TMB]|nr:hypothetical protein HWV62_25350 [Athelia sp. TMB]